MSKKRINKTKPVIKQEIEQIQNVNRMREFIKQEVYPFLLGLNESIGFTKIFLQTSASSLENIFYETQKVVKVKDLLPRLNEVFSSKEHEVEYRKYRKFFELLQEQTVYDFNTMINTMPRVIETYLTQQNDKNSIIELPIDKILG